MFNYQKINLAICPPLSGGEASLTRSLMSKRVKANMKPLDIHVLKKLIKLRGTLDTVSQISWSFSMLNKQHPVDSLSDEEANELISSYEELLDDLSELLEK